MNDLSQSPLKCKLRSLCNELCDLRIKEEHDATVKIYNAKSSDTPVCEHHMVGSTDHSIVKALATIGALVIVTTALCTACSFVRN